MPRSSSTLWVLVTRHAVRCAAGMRYPRRREDDSSWRMGFTETDCARFMDAAHRQIDGPVVLV